MSKLLSLALLLKSLRVLALDSFSEDDDNSCPVSGVPIYTLIGVLVFWLSIYVITSAADVYEMPFFRKEANLPVPKSEPTPVDTNRPPPRSQPQANQSSDPSDSSSSSSEGEAAQGGETETYYIKQENVIQSYGVSEVREKTALGRWCDNHLTFGLYNYRYSFPRWLRVTIVLAVWLFILAGIGVAFMIMEDVDAGDEQATEDLFEWYTVDYLIYGLVVLACSVPFTLTLIGCLRQARRPNCCLNFFGLFLAIAVIYAAIAVVVVLAYDFCFEMAGYWMITYLFMMPIEVFLLETIYMCLGYCCERKSNPAT